MGNKMKIWWPHKCLCGWKKQLYGNTNPWRKEVKICILRDWMQKPKWPSPLPLSFPFVCFIFFKVFITIQKKKKKELLIAYFSFILCPLSELKYELYENRSSVYTDCWYILFPLRVLEQSSCSINICHVNVRISYTMRN